eukprot:sb/3468991/
MEENDRYEIMPIPPETVRLSQILDLMNHFWYEEPICVICDLKRDQFLELVVAGIIAEGSCIMCVDNDTNTVVGIRFGLIVEDSIIGTVADNILTLIFHGILWLTDKERHEIHANIMPSICEAVGLKQPRDFFESLECSKMLTGTFLCVAPRARGMGLGRKMIQASEALAREKGATHTVLLASGFYSQRIFSSLHYTMVKEARYEDIRLKDGRGLPNLDKLNPIHTKVVLFTKKLDLPNMICN